MSLINDALKKAARQRAEEQADVSAPMPGGGQGRAYRGGDRMRTQTLVLIGGAAVVLIVVSVVVTGIYLAGKPENKVSAAIRPAQEPLSSTPVKIVLSAPTIAVPAPLQSTPTPSAAPAAPSPVPTPVPIVTLAEPPKTVREAVSPPASRNELIQGIVDRLHISGVRSAGVDSKALVDGHVYKVNEVIDRTIGLKLVTIEPDHLTFADANGNTYHRSL